MVDRFKFVMSRVHSSRISLSFLFIHLFSVDTFLYKPTHSNAKLINERLSNGNSVALISMDMIRYNLYQNRDTKKIREFFQGRDQLEVLKGEAMV